MLSRLGIVAALVLALSIAGAGAAYAVTYSFDDTATVVVLHPDTVEALADALRVESVTATVTAMPVSSFEASGVVPVRLQDSDFSEFQAVTVFALCLVVFGLGVVSVRSL